MGLSPRSNGWNTHVMGFSPLVGNVAACRRMEHPGNGTQSEGTHFSFSGRLVLWASSLGNPSQYGLQEVPRESALKRHASHHGADGARVASQLHDSVFALQLRWHARPWA